MAEAAGISAAMLLRWARLLEARGVAPGDLFAGAGLDVDELAAGQARVSYRQADALVEAVAERLGAAGLGLALARTRVDEAYGAAGLLLVTSPNLREGLGRAFAFQRIWGDGERFRLRVEAAGCAVTFRHPGPSALAQAVLAECALAETLAGARALVDPSAAALRVHLAHAPLGDPAELTQYFGVEPRFECAENALLLPHALCERPLHLLRDLLYSAVEQQCRRALDALPASSGVVERVRALVTQSLETPPSLAQVASRLRTSVRTLQRQLRDEGTTFQQVLDTARREGSEQLVRQGRALKEAALRVGYADPGALFRARRRWAGRR